MMEYEPAAHLVVSYKYGILLFGIHGSALRCVHVSIFMGCVFVLWPAPRRRPATLHLTRGLQLATPGPRMRRGSPRRGLPGTRRYIMS